MAAIETNYRTYSRPSQAGSRGNSYRTRPSLKTRTAQANASAPTPIEKDAGHVSSKSQAPKPVETIPVSVHALEAVHLAISGQPWADLEFVVPFKNAFGNKDATQSIFASSAILKKACPALMKEVNRTGALELDTMEDQEPNAIAKKAKNGNGHSKSVSEPRPSVSRRSTDLLDYGRPARERRPGRFGDHDAVQLRDDADAHHHEVHDEDDDEEYADSHADLERDDEEEDHHHANHGYDREDEHDRHPDDEDLFGGNDHEDDLISGLYSPAGHKSGGSSGKLAGSTLPTPSAELPTSPLSGTFNKSRFSKYLKFINKDRGATTPATDLETPPLSNAAATKHTDYLSEGAAGGGRVRRYSAGNELGLYGTKNNHHHQDKLANRSPTASKVQVRGCTPATLQALVFYLYTGQTRFARTPKNAVEKNTKNHHDDKSDDEEDEDVSDEDRDQEEDDEDSDREMSGYTTNGSKSLTYPPIFSSRAAYCLGHQLGLEDLKQRAFVHLSSLLSSKTVLKDLLSPFVDRFPEVQQAHLEYVASHWTQVRERPDFQDVVGRLVNGEYPKAQRALLSLFGKFSINA